MTTVIGVDLSLRSTGVAGDTWAETITTPELHKTATLAERWQRIRLVRQRLIPFIDGADLIVLEAPAYSRNLPGMQERAHLWWWLVGRCCNNEQPLAVVSPQTLKIYATGTSKADKDTVVAAVARRRPNIHFRGNDEADALVLAAMGLDHLGQPPVLLPATHRRALDSVQWPPLPERTAA